MKTIRWISWLWIPIYCIAQLNPGARQIALSNSDAGAYSDVFVIFNNPASVAKLGNMEAGLFYSPAPFGLKELANGAAAFNFPFQHASLGVGAKTYGYELYKENTFLLCYARELYSSLAIGVCLNYLNISISNYGNAGTLYFNTGVIYQPLPILSFGFYLFNVSRATIGSSNSEIPVSYNYGMNYSPFAKLSLSAAIEKDILYSASLKFGAEYTILNTLILRGGFATEPGTYSGGLGIKYSIINCDYAVVSHPDLGLTHQFGIIISFNN